jgi:hypothetical protein
MKRIIAGALLAVLVLTGAVLTLISGARSQGPLHHEVYVWQRVWTGPVRNAVTQQATNFTRIVPLKAEVTWKDKQPQLVRVALDYTTLANIRQPIGLALRVGPYAGPFATNDAVAQFLVETAFNITTEARSNGIALSELQIDFDCAESKLEGYQVWVEAIQRRVTPLPVTITALPSWLNAGRFKSLAKMATNYVLQVHSLDRPRSVDAPFSLCDPAAARRAVERAGRIGIPFRVALPTYGYTLAFQAEGKFIGLSAEGPRPNWPSNAILREVSSDPLEISALVRGWTTSRPAAMGGVIWYRLPTSADRFNWRWPTLGAIVGARVPQERFRADARQVEPRLVEISLANTGELDLSSRLTVDVRWDNARLVAADALQDFDLTEQSRTSARFQSRTNSRPLLPGDTRKSGWLRFDRDCEVTCEAKKI